MNSNESSEEVIKRLMLVYQVDTDVKLSEKLSKGKTTISTWRQRNKVPYSFCVRAAKELGLNLNWLILGKGEMYIDNNKDAEQPPSYILRIQADILEIKEKLKKQEETA